MWPVDWQNPDYKAQRPNQLKTGSLRFSNGFSKTGLIQSSYREELKFTPKKFRLPRLASPIVNKSMRY